MKKTLVLVRHATAEDQNFRMKDFERNLNTKGFAEAEAMGKWLAESNLNPDVMITSPASRALKTAEIVAKELGIPKTALVHQPEIYDGGPRAYLHAVNTAPESCKVLMLFGHNPDITYFAEYLSASNLGSMKKGSAVFIDFEDQKWEEISAKTGRLALYKTPKEARSE